MSLPLILAGTALPCYTSVTAGKTSSAAKDQVAVTVPRSVRPSPTPSDPEDLFYERYFRKGRESKEAPDLPARGGVGIDEAFKLPTPAPDQTRREREIDTLMHDLGMEAHRRQAAVERLSSLGEAAVPALIRGLQASQALARVGALDALGYIRSPNALPSVRRALRDPDADVRAEAARTLGRMRARSAADDLAVLAGDADPRASREAVVALVRVGGEAARDGLLRASRTGSEAGRRQALQELASLHGPDVMRILLKASQDPDVDIRVLAVRALGEQDNPAAWQRLRELSRADDPRVGREALQQLRRQTPGKE